MSAIFGYFSRSGSPLKPGIIDHMLQTSSGWNPHDKGTWSGNGIALGCALLHTTAESLKEHLPYRDEESHMVITADARIDNRTELSSVLGLGDHEGVADSIYILSAYQKWGTSCCKYLTGDYAFAVWDERKKELFCARDHIGTRSLFYSTTDDKFIFASDPKTILSTGMIPGKLREEWIVNCLINIHPAKDMAPFEHMKKLPPAHFLLVTPDKTELVRYWDFDSQKEIRYKNEQDYYDEMRSLMEQAIRSCIRSAFPVGAELSGGLDSSGIAAMAHKELIRQGKEVSTFSHVLPEWAEGKVYPFKDEKKYIDLLCAYSGINRKHYVTAEDKGLWNEFVLSVERFGYPTGYQLPVFCDALNEKARDEGVRILLSGFPGDELVTSHGTVFYEEQLFRHRYRVLWNEIYRRTDKNFLKTLYSLGIKILDYRLPRLYRFLKKAHKQDWRDISISCCVATDEYFNRHHLRERYLSETTYPDFNNVRKREHFRITDDFVSFRLEQFASQALYYHLEYRNPFADRRLAEFVMAIPSEFKLRNRYTRYPYRMSMEGIIPEEIRWRKDKTGATIPSVSMRILNDNEFLSGLLDDRSAGWPSFIDLSKMQDIRDRMYNRRIEEPVYSSSYLAALMLAAYHNRISPV